MVPLLLGCIGILNATQSFMQVFPYSAISPRIFPAFPRSLASVLIPRPAASPFCFGCAALKGFGFQKIFSAIPQKRGKKRFSEPSEKARLRPWERGTLASLRARVSRGQSGQIQTRRNKMALYENNLKLRGYVGKNAENFATKQQKTFTVLSLATKSGYKDKQTQQWVNHTEWHRIVAFGKPADYAKNLKKGDYVEIEGELRSTEFDAEVGEGKKKTTVKRRGWEVRASIVRKLAQPASQGTENPDADPITEDDAA
jgi:single-strand DNA-binding protein